jgi:Tol biopolymer transport system component
VYYLTRKPENPNYRALFQIPSLGGTPRERVFDVDSRASFSPDGKKIVFWRGVPQKREDLLVVLDLETSRERLLATIGGSEAHQGSAAWSPDGSVIGVALPKPAPDLETTIAFFDAGSGERRDFLKLPRMLLASLTWLPDGRGLVASGQDLRSALNNQVFLIGHPDARLQRVTNDFYRYFSVSVSAGEEAIAAVRLTRLANLWLAEATGRSARALTSVTNPEDSPLGVSVTGSDTVVFEAGRDQAVQIWATGAAGGEPRALTSGNAQSINVLGAGEVVFFDRLDESGVHIWRMRADGSELRQLTFGAGEQKAAVSRDGRLVAFQPYDAPRTVSVLSVESGTVTTIASDGVGVAGFSPDSASLLVARQEADAQGLERTVWRAVPVSGGPETATFRLPGPAVGPAWGPDGRSVTFRNQADPAWNVYVQDDEGREPVPLTRFTEGRITGYSWSPDGSRLALVRSMNDDTNVWVTGRDGGRPVQVTQLSSSNVFAVRWLPDSRRLVVSAGKLSRDVVLIRSFR